MTYSCTDFADTIIDALGVDVPDESSDSPSDQAELCLEAIEALQQRAAVTLDTMVVCTGMDEGTPLTLRSFLDINSDGIDLFDAVEIGVALATRGEYRGAEWTLRLSTELATGKPYEVTSGVWFVGDAFASIAADEWQSAWNEHDEAHTAAGGDSDDCDDPEALCIRDCTMDRLRSLKRVATVGGFTLPRWDEVA